MAVRVEVMGLNLDEVWIELQKVVCIIHYDTTVSGSNL
jgi:hypothetical protein